MISKKQLYLAIAASSALFTQAAMAGQFSYLDPGYSQDIFTATIPTGWGPGYAWTSAGNMVLRGGSSVYEYSLTDNVVYNGTNVRGYTAHSVSGLDSTGYGMTNGNDGYFYANSASGIQRINPSTWTATTYAGSTGGYYGIATLPDGRIAHTDSNSIFVLDPVSGMDSHIYTAGSFIDGIATTGTGEIFLSDLGSYRIRVINSLGVELNNFAVTHGPDGMAFGGGSAYANNTDGTITKISFAGPGYTGAATETIFASGGTYGDLASAGPDCNFYVSQWGNVNWDGGATSDSTVVRISSSTPGVCGFTPPPGGGPKGVPEPSALWLLAIGVGLLGFSHRRLKSA